MQRVESKQQMLRRLWTERPTGNRAERDLMMFHEWLWEHVPSLLKPDANSFEQLRSDLGELCQEVHDGPQDRAGACTRSGGQTAAGLLLDDLVELQERKAALESVAHAFGVCLGQESVVHLADHQNLELGLRIREAFVDTCRNLKVLQAQLVAARHDAE